MYSWVQLKFDGEDYFVVDYLFVKYKTNVHYVGTIDLEKMAASARAQMAAQAKRLGEVKKDNVNVKKVKWKMKN